MSLITFLLRWIPSNRKQHLTMLLNQVQIDIRNRYLGTVLGFAWAVLNPILSTGIYSFVIVFVFRARLSADSTPLDYIVFILSGLIPWLAFQEGIFSATNSVVSNSNIVKNLPFPVEIFPLSGVLSSLFSLGVGLVLVFIGLLISGRPLGWPLLFLPVAIFLQIYFALGFGFFLASLSVFVRDVSQLLTYFFMLVLYMSPVMYDISMMPLSVLSTISLYNPVYHFIAMYRNIFYNNRLPDLAGCLYLFAISSVLLLAGYRFFRRTKAYFSDYLA